MSVRFCVITTEQPSCVTKEFRLINGKLTKSTVANITRGSMEIRGAANALEFAELLQGLKVNQCLTYGLPPRNADLVTEFEWHNQGEPDNPLPRTKDVFSWPVGPGIMMGDYDAPKDGTKPLGRTALVKAVLSVAHALNNSDFVWWSSTSSNIYEGETKLNGLKGQRIYLFVADASDIERAGGALNDRLWLQGHGRYDVSESGQLLERPLFDGSVWQTNRIDFAAGASCASGLTQRRGAPQVFGGDQLRLLDTRMAIPDLTEDERRRVNELKDNAKAALEKVATERRTAWIEARSQDIQKAKPTLSQNQAYKAALRAIESRELMPEFIITIQTGSNEQQVTISEVLASPSQYHGLHTLDPLEPDYDGRRFVGKLFLDGAQPNLFSFAHGGANFRLRSEPQRIEVVPGKSRQVADELLDVLRSAPDIFDYGQELVQLGSNGQLQPLTESTLQYVAGGLVQFFARQSTGKETKEVLRDPPPKVCKMVVDLRAQRQLKQLNALITAPTLKPNGMLLSSQGYDATTGLFVDAPLSRLPIPEHPTMSDAQRSLETLWHPFTDFPFCGPIDRAVHLAAILTAAVRAALPTTPAFGYDAPVQGSGKTLLARCVGVIAQGTDPGVWPHTSGKDDEEIRKRLFTALLTGSRALVWDNVVGAFDSAAMASCITSPSYQDRKLGTSDSKQIPNRMMILITGNNIELQGEMPRRVLVTRIDPATDQPFAREFALEPFSYCRDHRQNMIAASLTLIRAMLTHGCRSTISGKLASFEQWDLWVRRTVMFANELTPGKFGDVMQAVTKNQAVDPDLEAIGSLLQAWEQLFGQKPTTVSTVINKIKPQATIGAENDLRDAVEALVGRPINQTSAKTLGKALGYRKDRIVDGRRLEIGPKISGTKTWRLGYARSQP